MTVFFPPAWAAAPVAVSVAAASNLVYALDAIGEAHRTAHPDVTLSTTVGASGSLVAQIAHGAPFDVFLSADTEYPRALITAGHAGQATVTAFATGQLVLWTTRADLTLEPLADALPSPRIRRLAIANVDAAPYGRAARETLESLGLWVAVQPRLVVGENVTQTAQFVETGSADAGFVALSLVRSPRLAGRGRWVVVPSALYSPLTHGAVLTRRGAANPAAADFLRFLLSPEAQAILGRFGYRAP